MDLGYSLQPKKPTGCVCMKQKIGQHSKRSQLSPTTPIFLMEGKDAVFTGSLIFPDAALSTEALLWN